MTSAHVKRAPHRHHLPHIDIVSFVKKNAVVLIAFCAAVITSVVVPPDAEYAETPLPMARRVKVFFTPPMIIFVALCAVQVLYMLLYAVLY